MSPPPYTFIESTEALQTCLETIVSARAAAIEKKVNPHCPLLYVDIEGNDLCRFGSVSLVQIHVPIVKHTFVLDVLVLGKLAFTTSIMTDVNPFSLSPDASASKTTVTLQALLESPEILKCFFDVRNDSDALYNIYGIFMSGIVDLQILEVATRRGSKKLLNGLARAIKTDSGLSQEVLSGWMAVKMKGKDMFNASRPSVVAVVLHGRPPEPTNVAKEELDYSIIDERPLPVELLEYSINDVIHLPRLWGIYDAKLTDTWRAKVENESVWRLNLAKQDMYYGKNGNMALGPF